jgi:hypothetical protein
MSSIYQRVLGHDFARLHPEIQRRFGFSSADRLASIGTGIMDEVWKGGSTRSRSFASAPGGGSCFPKPGARSRSRSNYAFVDRFGRETVSWVLTFESRRTRRFDAYMVYSENRGRIVDYLGTHQHLAVDIDISADEAGGLRLRSGAQRFYEGLIGFTLPMAFSGTADVREWTSLDKRVAKDLTDRIGRSYSLD